MIRKDLQAGGLSFKQIDFLGTLLGRGFVQEPVLETGYRTRLCEDFYAGGGSVMSTARYFISKLFFSYGFAAAQI